MLIIGVYATPFLHKHTLQCSTWGVDLNRRTLTSLLHSRLQQASLGDQVDSTHEHVQIKHRNQSGHDLWCEHLMLEWKLAFFQYRIIYRVMSILRETHVCWRRSGGGWQWRGRVPTQLCLHPVQTLHSITLTPWIANAQAVEQRWTAVEKEVHARVRAVAQIQTINIRHQTLSMQMCRRRSGGGEGGARMCPASACSRTLNLSHKILTPCTGGGAAVDGGGEGGARAGPRPRPLHAAGRPQRAGRRAGAGAAPARPHPGEQGLEGRGLAGAAGAPV